MEDPRYDHCRTNPTHSLFFRNHFHQLNFCSMDGQTVSLPLVSAQRSPQRVHHARLNRTMAVPASTGISWRPAQHVKLILPFNPSSPWVLHLSSSISSSLHKVIVPTYTWLAPIPRLSLSSPWLDCNPSLPLRYSTFSNGNQDQAFSRQDVEGLTTQ